MSDLTAEIPINYAACAYRDYRSGVATRDGAALIVMSALRLPADAAYAVLDAAPHSDDLARALCLCEGWSHHDQTDDYPCTNCKADAGVLSNAADPDGVAA